jgi:hypothetical protein
MAMSDREADVIDLTAVLDDKDRPRIVDDREWKEKRCRCEKMQFSIHDRKLWCKLCGTIIDPYRWIADEIKKNYNLWDQRNSLRKQNRELAEQLDDIKRQVRNAKAQLKRATRHA